MTRHETHMRRAIAAAQQNPSCPFGAVLVDARSDEVVAQAVNRSQFNPTWHGEIEAINQFSERASNSAWRHLHLYTTAEPCCMCQGAILWAEIPLVVFGISITRLQQLGWHQIDIPAQQVVDRASFAQCRLIGGILATECERLFADASDLK